MDVLERFSLRTLRQESIGIPGLTISTLDLDRIEDLQQMNVEIFGEERIINTFDREDLTMLIAHLDGVPAGFKVGYRENRFVFYSAKGGVMREFRRRGIARALMDALIERARELGYSKFAFDTFPNHDRGMTVMALVDGFRLVKADYNSTYNEYRLRFEKKIEEAYP